MKKIMALIVIMTCCSLAFVSCSNSDNYSEGIEFTSNGDGSCDVSGIGTCTDAEILIPPSYNGDKVTSIGGGAFQGCTGLTSIVIPDSVTSIRTVAFQGCSNLTSIDIPNSVTSIDITAFQGCSNLTEIRVTEGNPVFHSDGNCLIETKTKTLVLGFKNSVIPNDGSVTSIGPLAFSTCSGLTSIDIPNSVTSIDITAFQGCSNLTEIRVTEGNPVFHSDGNCLIETKTKTLVLGFKNSVIPNDGSVTSIGPLAFSTCSGLTSIDIPDSVTSIDLGAFSNCTGLTSIDIPDSVTNIGNSAFSDCSGLTSVTIPDSVTSIGDMAFSSCTSLISIHIPTSVTSMGGSAFFKCFNLTDIYYTGTESEWNAISKGLLWDENTGSYTIHYNYIP